MYLFVSPRVQCDYEKGNSQFDQNDDFVLDAQTLPEIQNKHEKVLFQSHYKCCQYARNFLLAWSKGVGHHLGPPPWTHAPQWQRLCHSPGLEPRSLSLLWSARRGAFVGGYIVSNIGRFEKPRPHWGHLEYQNLSIAICQANERDREIARAEGDQLCQPSRSWRFISSWGLFHHRRPGSFG